MKNNNIDDLRHIRSLMERSSKFLSLSGLSAIAAGSIALIGAAVAYYLLYEQEFSTIDIRIRLIILAMVIMGSAVSFGWYFSFRKAKKSGTKLWTPTARRTLYHFLIPLFTGGLFCIALIINNNTHLVSSAMLIFYGLSLVNSGKFTVDEIHYLGLGEILLGLLACFFLNHGLLFWTVGFGILHIIFGIRMYYKYDRK